MRNKPGYPLPAGDLTGDDLNCMILFYPDRTEYRRALWASLDYLGTWLAWETDAQKRGKDAAEIWKAANECTQDCFNMGCLDTLNDNVAAILALLQGTDFCCNGSTTIGPAPTVETEIEPGVGDAPDYYGETAVTDWDDWSEHVCYNAHKYVDYLVSVAESFDSAASNGILTLAIMGAGLALLSFTGIGIPIAITIAVTALSAFAAAGALIYSTTAADIEDARDTIVCALLNGDDLRDVMRETLGEASLDWTSTFQYVDYESATAILYEGGANGEYLPSETRDDCDCEDAALFTWLFTSDVDGWASYNGLVLNWLSAGLIEANPNTASGWRLADGGSGNEILTQFGETGSYITVTKMAVKFKFYYSTTPIGWSFKFGVVETGTDAAFESDVYTSAIEGSNVWIEKEFTFASPVTLRTSAYAVHCSANRDASAAEGQRVHIESIKLWGTIT